MDGGSISWCDLDLFVQVREMGHPVLIKAFLHPAKAATMCTAPHV